MRKIVLSLSLLMTIFGLTTLVTAAELTPVEIVAKSLQTFYYQGNDLKANVTMNLTDKNGKRRNRVLTMLRLNTANGEQKYYIYFHQPGDVRRMTFMVWKYQDKDDDRWLYIPAVDMVRRIAADDKRSSFVGSDFTYEDISGRDPKAEEHQLLRTESLNGKECYVIESIPKTASDYTKRICWIDKSDFMPLQEEYYDVQKSLYKVFTADKVELMDGFITATQRTMKNVKTGHSTTVSSDSVTYNQGLEEKEFNERKLRQPPRDWIK